MNFECVGCVEIVGSGVVGGVIWVVRWVWIVDATGVATYIVVVLVCSIPHLPLVRRI
jgi:hypothetical protein